MDNQNTLLKEMCDIIGYAVSQGRPLSDDESQYFDLLFEEALLNHEQSQKNVSNKLNRTKVSD